MYNGNFRFTGVVNNPAVSETPVPEVGSTMVLFGMALTVLGIIRQKFAV